MNLPQGHQAVMPYLILDTAEAFIRFITEVFGAEIVSVHQREDQPALVMHGEAHIGGSRIMFADATGRYRPQVAGMFVYVDNADETFARAKAAGGTVVTELSDQAYGRTCGVEDPTGNTWWITSV